MSTMCHMLLLTHLIGLHSTLLWECHQSQLDRQRNQVTTGASNLSAVAQRVCSTAETKFRSPDPQIYAISTLGLQRIRIF